MTQGDTTVIDSSADRRRGRALGLEVEVVPDRGQWSVDIVVFFSDGVVRRRVQTCRTERLARLSAECIRRGADRDIAGPING